MLRTQTHRRSTKLSIGIAIDRSSRGSSLSEKPTIELNKLPGRGKRTRRRGTFARWGWRSSMLMIWRSCSSQSKSIKRGGIRLALAHIMLLTSIQWQTLRSENASREILEYKTKPKTWRGYWCSRNSTNCCSFRICLSKNAKLRSFLIIRNTSGSAARLHLETTTDSLPNLSKTCLLTTLYLNDW